MLCPNIGTQFREPYHSNHVISRLGMTKKLVWKSNVKRESYNNRMSFKGQSNGYNCNKIEHETPTKSDNIGALLWDEWAHAEPVWNRGSLNPVPWAWSLLKHLIIAHKNLNLTESATFVSVICCLPPEDRLPTEFNPMYTDGLFHYYMLDEFVCHFRSVRSILSLLFYFWWQTLLANNVDSDQTPHVASDLGLHCLPIAFAVFSHVFNKNFSV